MIFDADFIPLVFAMEKETDDKNKRPTKNINFGPRYTKSTRIVENLPVCRPTRELAGSTSKFLPNLFFWEVGSSLSGEGDREGDLS